MVSKASDSAVKAVEELDEPGTAAKQMSKVKSKLESAGKSEDDE